MAYRGYSTANGLIVDYRGVGDFTAIQPAINAAVSGQTVFVNDGVYTEDITLKDGVGLTSFSSNGLNGNVTTVGTVTLTSGIVVTSGINFSNVGDYVIIVSGSSAATWTMYDCEINFSNHNAINFTNSNAGSSLIMESCVLSLGPGGSNTVYPYDMTSPGTLDIDFCRYLNQANSTGIATSSAGTTNLRCSFFPSQISVTGTGIINGFHSTIAGQANGIGLTIDGTGTSKIYGCQVSGGTSSAISVGAGATLTALQCDIFSTDTNAITGGGTLNAGILTFTGSSSTINTTTVNKLTTYGGTIV